MNYRQLGQSGLRVSVIGLGTNRFGGKVDEKGVAEIIHMALDQGVNFIDTADIYTDGRSEETIGKAIASVATKSCSPPRSVWKWETGPTMSAPRATAS